MILTKYILKYFDFDQIYYKMHFKYSNRPSLFVYQLAIVQSV